MKSTKRLTQRQKNLELIKLCLKLAKVKNIRTQMLYYTGLSDYKLNKEATIIFGNWKYIH